VVSLLEKYTLLRLHALKDCTLSPGGNWTGEWRMCTSDLNIHVDSMVCFVTVAHRRQRWETNARSVGPQASCGKLVKPLFEK
jgi:hypothetical protein